MKQFIPIILTLTSCLNSTTKQPINAMSIHEVGQKLTGHWKLISTETKDGERITNSNPDRLEYYEFDGLKGVISEMTDNHDGTFSVPTCQPACELKEKAHRKIIEYIGPADQWELEIVGLSNDKLVLTNSKTRWTYERRIIKNW